MSARDDIRAGRRRGVALLPTLQVVGLLTASVLTFIRLTHLEALAADNAYAFTQAEILARAGLKGAMTTLAMDDAAVDSPKDAWNRFQQYAALAGGLFDEGSFTGTIQDLSGRFNPNYLVDQSGLVVEDRLNQFKRLLVLMGLDEDVAVSVLDWIDADDEPRPGGAENTYYLGLEKPYPCLNQPLITLGQLRRIKGLTPKVLQGEKERPGLLDLLTVDSNGQINVNTAPKAILESLDDALTPAMAEAIMERRKTEPFPKLDDLRLVTDLSPELLARITGRLAVNSSHFLILVEGSFRDAKVRATAVVRRTGGGVKLVYYRVG